MNEIFYGLHLQRYISFIANNLPPLSIHNSAQMVFTQLITAQLVTTIAYHGYPWPDSTKIGFMAFLMVYLLYKILISNRLETVIEKLLAKNRFVPFFRIFSITFVILNL
jgi:hypothetical protein